MNPLITTGDLADRLADPGVRLADVRWYLDDPTGGIAAYRQGHIPGAVFVDLDHHLSVPVGPGRHPLPDRTTAAATMGALGFGDEHTIVAYDDRGGAVAARLWWMLRDLGHDAVRVLDGGITAWIAEGRPLEREPARHHAATMTIRPSATRTVDRVSLRADPGRWTLLDAREPVRYRGEEEPVDPVAGHIPGAFCVPATGNLAADGRFLTPEVLATRFAPYGGDDVVVYCGSGVTACHLALAMEVAGMDMPILYPGSWSDWSTAGEPAAVGPEPG